MKKSKGKIWITLGLIFLAAAFCLTAFNLYDELRAERSARQAVESLKKHIPTKNTSQMMTNEENEIPDYILNPNMEMPTDEQDRIDYIGILRIPSLDLELPVISEWSYSNLRIAPCRYSGSTYQDNLSIAAHNYPSHFGLLKTMSEGDEVLFTDMDGNIFNYQVVCVETLTPIAVNDIVDSGYDLSLFTCTLSGQSRVAVRCDRAVNK